MLSIILGNKSNGKIFSCKSSEPYTWNVIPLLKKASFALLFKELNSVTEYLIDNTSFDLPSEFLQKWLATAGEKQLTSEQAAEEYNKSEKGLRYQLIQ